MAESTWERNPIDKLADEFLERHRRGENPAVAEYADKYPELAEEILDLFPALVMMEDLKPRKSEETTPAPDGGPDGKKLDRLGDYRILREVGRGGMGIVYEAEQESLGRRVALKVLPAQALLDPRQYKRFQREAKAAARLHHTNIVPVFGVGEHEGLHYYVMQFIQGLGLDEVLRELKRLRSVKTAAPPPAAEAQPRAPGELAESVTAGTVAQALLTGRFAPAGAAPGEPTDPYAGAALAPATLPKGVSADSPDWSVSSSSLLPGAPSHGSSLSLSDSGRHYWRSVARTGVQVADALEYAHGQGVLHRDIKPSNLLLDNQGTVWVTDFGLAKATSAEGEDLTHTGDIIGTLRYMAPERFGGQSDAGGDIYSLGLTLYEMLVFAPAFGETDHKRLIHQVTHEEPPRPRKLNRAIPRDLETIVLKATEREPARRYPTAKAFSEDLQRFLDDKPIRARQVSGGERFWRWCRRNPALAASSAIAAAGLVAVTVFALLYASAQARNAAQQAQSNAILSLRQREARAERDRATQLAAELSVALNETKKHEAILAAEKGHMLIERGQLASGMLWLARGLERAPADALAVQDSIRSSLAAAESEAPVLRLVLTADPYTRAAAFSPDGRMILTGAPYYGASGAALWDAVTGQLLGRLARDNAHDLAVAFLPDAKTVRTGTGGQRAEVEVRTWDAASRKHLGRLPLGASLAQVTAMAFRPDGQAIATASMNMAAIYTSAISVWDSATGKPLGKPLAVAGYVYGLAFSPNGKTIVTAIFDPQASKGEARFWDAATGKPAREPLPHVNPVTSVAFSPDGRLLLSGSGVVTSDTGEAQLWEVATGKPAGAPLTQSGRVWNVAFSPDGRTVLVGGFQDAIYLWELPADRLMGPLFAHSEIVSSVAFSPDGKSIVTGTGTSARGGVAQRWDLASGRPIGPPLPQPGYVLAVAFSRDGTKLATGAGYLQQDKGEARLWDPLTGKPLGAPLLHPNDVNALAFSPDGNRLLTGSADSTARLWDCASGQQVLGPLVHPGKVHAVAFSPDGKKILTGCEKEARLWDTFTGRPVGAPLEHQATVTSVCFSPSGLTFATACSDHLVFLWDAATAKPRGIPLDHAAAVTAVVFSPDGKFLLTGCGDHTARLWDAGTGLPIGTALRHPKPVTSVAFSPDGRTILTGCEDRLARLWDAATAVTEDNARLVRRAQVQTGMELTPLGAARRLEEATRRERRESLAAPAHPAVGPSQHKLPWHLRQAMLCIDAGDWSAALWQLDRHSRDHPEDDLACSLRCRAHLEQDRLDLAAADFSRSLTLAPPESVLPRFRAFATQAIEDRRPKRAFWYLDRLIQTEPRDGFAWLARGRLYTETNQWKEAARDMARGVVLDPADHWDWYHATMLVLHVGDVARYRDLCKGMLDQFGDTQTPTIAERTAKACLVIPDAVADGKRLSRLADRAVALGSRSSFLPYFELAKGMAEYREGRFASAVDWLKRTLRSPSWNKDVPAQSFLALSYHRLGQSEQARQALDKAHSLLAQVSGSGDGRLGSAYVDQIISQVVYREAASLLDVPHRKEAEESLAKRQWSDAVGHLDRLIQSDPAFWPDWVSRSCASAELGRQAPADADFARALELVNDDPYPWLKRGRFYAQLDRHDQAAADFARALERMPEALPHFALRKRSVSQSGRGQTGWQMERRELYRELLGLPPVFARLLELRPQDSGLRLARAQAHAQRKEWNSALPDIDQAVELSPADPELRLERGRCLANLGRWDRAAQEYSKGLNSRPGGYVWFEAATAHLAARNTEAYRSVCARMLIEFGKKDSEEESANLIRTLVLAPGAVADMGPVIALGRKHRESRWLGPALYRAGKFEEAISELEQSANVLIGVSQCRAWLFLAMAHSRLGGGATARQCLTKAQGLLDEADRSALYDDRFHQTEWQILRREAEELVKER